MTTIVDPVSTMNRSDTEEAAAALILLSQHWCAGRPTFLEPCPELCGRCFWGAKPTCDHLQAPRSLQRQMTLGAQSPKETQEKK